MYTPGEIAYFVLALAFFPVLGWISLRYLRAAPDLPHKAEMIWGAKWGGLILTLFLLGPMLVSMVMIESELPYAITAMGVAQTFLMTYLAFGGALLVWQFAGVGLAVNLMSSRLKREPTDLATAVERMEKWRRGRGMRALAWVFGVLTVFWLGMTVLVVLPADRFTAALWADEELRTEAKQALSGLPLKGVMLERKRHIWAPFTPVVTSMRHSVPGHPNASYLLVVLKGDATPEDLEPALHAAKQFLQSRRLRGEWLVRVTVGCDHRLEEIWSPDESRQGGAG